MDIVIGTVAAAILVTLVAAKWITARRPNLSYGLQVILATMSSPVVAILLFVVATVYTLALPDLPEPGGTVGMVIFAFVFFLIYAMAIGAAVGLVTALIAVRMFRR
ncbi:hypothetical protein TPR58_12800 [Sphingomonas sp. HF-S3]|uniref:Uncharacterized protein n=1 Tax=Sphingomonas rustica TaxID=3103142 RepID=A0ABV0BCC9_9SPHN